MTDHRPETNPVHDPIDDDAVVHALHELAQRTDPNPGFAATLQVALHQRAEELAAQRTPSQQVLWWQRLSTANWNMRPIMRLQYGLLGLLLVATLIVATTPTARATIWEWLYSFGIIEESTVAHQILPLDHVELLSDEAMALAEIQQQAPFAVTTPTWLPADLRFTGGFVDETAEGTQATLAYHLPEWDENDAVEAPLLFILISNGNIENFPLVAQDYVVPVRLDRIVGMYAQGGWASQSAVTAASTTVDDLYWDETQDVAWLSWQVNGLSYLLYAQGLDVQAEAMTAIAVSMMQGS